MSQCIQKANSLIPEAFVTAVVASRTTDVGHGIEFQGGSVAVAYLEWVYRREASAADDECERLIKVGEPSWQIVSISARRCLGALDLVRCGSGQRNDPMDQTGHVAATGLRRPRSQPRQYLHRRPADDAATPYGVAVPFNPSSVGPIRRRVTKNLPSR
jgi:hypothetical protein